MDSGGISSKSYDAHNADYIIRDVEDNIALQVTQSYIQLLLAKAWPPQPVTIWHYGEVLQAGRGTGEDRQSSESDLIDIKSQLGQTNHQ